MFDRKSMQSVGAGGILRAVIGAVAVASFNGVLTHAAQAADEVNVYSFRQEHLIRPLLDAFTADTGVQVNLVSGTADALIERLRTEGRNSPADVFMTADVGRLIAARDAGVLQPVKSPRLDRLVPAQYRDPEGHWYGLSVRARVVYYAPDRVDPANLSTYAALAEPRWKGRVCIRSSSNVYNQSLLAALIARHGADEALAWARGMVANFARTPQGGDRDQIKAVAAGECDIAVGNTYYLGGMLASKKEDERAAAQKVRVFFPGKKEHGTHVNISGAGVTVSARNREAAVRLLEFLAGDAAQKIFAEDVYEYPLRAGIPVATEIAAWGTFKADDLNLAEIGKHQAEAVRLFDKAGWR
jgi:iron(III) transport system substrate-binding protein